MIIKGNRHGNGARLAAYLMDGGKHGERVAEPELFGFAAENIFDAFGDVHTAAGVHAIEKPLFHVQIRLPEQDQMTRAQWDQTTARVLKTAGLEGQPYARVFHTDEKTGEMHCHLAVSLIDEQTHHAKPLPFYKFRFKALARKLEIEFGLTRVRNRRDSPIEHAATRNEEQQAQRHGFGKEAVRNSIRQCWDASDCGHAFDDALAEAGLILAQGSRRSYVVIDLKGGVHSVSQRILDTVPSEIAEKLSDLDRDNLPTVDQAKELMLDMPRDRVERLTRELAEVQKQIAAEQEYARRDPVREEIEWLDAVAMAAIEKEKVERQFVEPKAERQETRAGQKESKRPEPARERAPELGKTQAEIRLARRLSPGPQSFANELEDRGFILAAITSADIEKEMEKLREEWEERRKNPQSWMEHEGGYAALPEKFQESARRSFDAWQEQQEQKRRQSYELQGKRVPKPPELSAEDRQKKLEDYAQYVQGKWAEGPKSRLERATAGLAVITPFGSVYTLTSRNTGLSRDELPEYLKGIDRTPLLSVTDAQASMEDLRQHRHEERQARQPVGAAAAGIRLAYALTQSGPDFAAAIEDRGLTMACVSEADAERLNRWERQRLREEKELRAATKQNQPQRKERDIESYEKYQAGELVIVNQHGSVFQLDAATTGAHTAKREERLNQIDRAPLMSVTDAQTAMTHYQQHRRQEWLGERERLYEESLMHQPLSGTAGSIRLAYTLTRSGPDFAADIKERGLILALTTEADAERLNRWERQRLKEARAAQAPEQEGQKPRKVRNLDSYTKYQAGEFVIINQYGSVFQLDAATTGAHKANREARLNEIDRAPLMDVKAAQAAMQHYQRRQRQEWREQRQQERNAAQREWHEGHWPSLQPTPERQAPSLFGQAANEAAADPRTEDPRGAAAEVWDIYRRAGNDHHFEPSANRRVTHAVKTGDREAFATALDDRGVMFARATKDEAEKSYREASFAREIGNYAPRFKEGEIVIVTEPPLEYRRDGQQIELRRVHKLDQSIAEKYLRTLGTAAEKLRSIEATLEASDERAKQRRAEREEARFERATDLNHGVGWQPVKNVVGVMDQGARTAARIMDAAPRAITAAFDVSANAAGALFSILDTPKSPRQQARDNYEGEKITAESNAEADIKIDFSKFTAERMRERENEQQEQAARDRERENERQR